MRYLLSALIPPLGVLLSGRVFFAAFMFVVWVAAVVAVNPYSHAVFVLVAWLVIAQANGDRRLKKAIIALSSKET